jgi:hypothetical protein
MADIWLALHCQQKRIGMVALERERAWLTANPTPDTGIYERHKNDDAAQTTLINSISQWKHHAHIPA